MKPLTDTEIVDFLEAHECSVERTVFDEGHGAQGGFLVTRHGPEGPVVEKTIRLAVTTLAHTALPYADGKFLP